MRQEFLRAGYVRMDGGFSAELARQCRDELWAAMGLSPNEPSRWTRPVVRLPGRYSAPFVAAANTPALHAAWDALVSPGQWLAPRGLGTFVIRFPLPIRQGMTAGMST
jgi:hypothetical protein